MVALTVISALMFTVFLVIGGLFFFRKPIPPCGKRAARRGKRDAMQASWWPRADWPRHGKACGSPPGGLLALVELARGWRAAWPNAPPSSLRKGLSTALIPNSSRYPHHHRGQASSEAPQCPPRPEIRRLTKSSAGHGITAVPCVGLAYRRLPRTEKCYMHSRARACEV